MVSKKVKDVADKISTLSPNGQALVKSIIDASSNDVDYIGTIRDASSAIEILKSNIKTKKEMIDDHVGNYQEWLDLESAKDEVERCRVALNVKLAGDADYNNSMEAMADMKLELKDKQDTLSTFIVAYHTETKENQIEIGTNGDARRLVIKGKLGRVEKYQTNIFSDRKDLN